jgi:hypothetical protein
MAGSVVAQGQRGTRRACAIVAAGEQQIESLAEFIDFFVFSCRFKNNRS